MFYLINVADVVNVPQPCVFTGGGLHALIRIFGGYSHARYLIFDLKVPSIRCSV